MSGIEPLAALGLVCNILQLIEVGSQTCGLIKVVYQRGSIDDSLKQKAVILGNISEDIKPVNRPANRHEQQLVDTAESCARAARQLREEIIHLIGNAKKGRLSSAVRAAMRTFWRKPRLDRLKNELDEAEKLMQTGLLVQIMSTVNGAELDLTSLDADVRSLVQEYRNGNRDTKTLVTREGLKTRTHVSNAIKGTNEAIQRVGQDLGRLALDVDVQVDQAKCESLLNSLKYPGFNERRNDVREAHPATLQWVFTGDDGKSAEKMSTIKWDSFSNWLKSTDTVYWISGKPGSGKSTMVKYILADSQIRTTQRCLDLWSQRCLIISHYFWRPGNPMQRSIKGMICSLLYQLLANGKKALAMVLASVTTPTMKKRDVTDWSLEELQSTLLRTMETYGRPICIFLDGLDEVESEQSTDLLDMILEKFTVSSGKIKMCLASRPEPPLQRRLYNKPQLRLQDLNARDVTQYVNDHIQASKFPNLQDYRDFVELLVNRAEGVFLWLVLVTKSVRTGFDNGDTIEIITERVNGLQGGNLESLYKDMWDRVSRGSRGNPISYKRRAAQYFKIMLIYNLEQRLQIYGDKLSVFTMMLASTELAEKILNAAGQTSNIVPEGTLLQGCKEVERIAEIYCFGLLEVSERDREEVTEEVVGWYGCKYNKLLPYARVLRALSFIHRTAVDFLVDTAQGEEILSFDDTTESSLAFRLVAANLAHAQLFCTFTEEYFRVGGVGESNLVIDHLWSIDGMRNAYIDAGKSVTADYTRNLMHCKELCDSGKLLAGGVITDIRVCSGADFFKVVAEFRWRCLDIFEDQIKALDKETVTEILHILCSLGIWGSANSVMEVFDGLALRLIRLLLTAGADPNWTGTHAFSRRPRRFTCRQTAFSAFSLWILEQAQRDKRGRSYNEFSRNDPTDILRTVQTFIHYKADLDEKATMTLNVERDWPSNAQSLDICQYLNFRQFSEWDDLFREFKTISEDVYICSFPARSILNLVLSEWEPLRSLSNEETLSADVKSSVAYTTGRHRIMNGSVPVRLEVTLFADLPCPSEEDTDKWRWCVAPREHQEQISKELLGLMDLSERSEFCAATQKLRYETLKSMLCGPHWVEKGQGRGCFDSALNYLVDLRLFDRHKSSRTTCKIRTVKDWLKLQGVLHAA